MAAGRNRYLARAAAFGFIAFLIAAVVIADHGQGAQWWPFINRISFGDKLGHLGLFGTLGFLCNLAFPSQRVRYIRFITENNSRPSGDRNDRRTLPSLHPFPDM